MRKLLSLLLSIVMIFSFSINCFAYENLTMVGKTENNARMATGQFTDTIMIGVGETCKIIVNSNKNSNFIWTSSNERVATVSDSGEVLARINGETIITLTDATIDQISVSIRVIVGTGVEKIVYFAKGANARESTISNYIGPYFSVLAFETGTLYSGSTDEQIQDTLKHGTKFRPNAFGNYDFPSYGCCQMIEGTVTGFVNWLKENHYTIWSKMFRGIPIVCEEDSKFTERWINAASFLNTEEYIQFGLLQIEYMYRLSGLSNPNSTVCQEFAELGINPNRSRVLQELLVYARNQGASYSVIKQAKEEGLITKDSTDKDIIKAICYCYGTYIHWAEGLTNGMRAKWYGDGNGAIYRYFMALADLSYPVFSFDDITASKNANQTKFVSGEVSNPYYQPKEEPEVIFEITVESRPIEPTEPTETTPTEPEPTETVPTETEIPIEPVETEPIVEETQTIEESVPSEQSA